MIRSMTGYSSVRRELSDLRLKIELKTLNHRTFDLRYHSSRSLSLMEAPIRDRLQSVMPRGRIEIVLRGEASQDSRVQINTNPELAERYAESLSAIAKVLPETGKIRLEHVISLPGVFEIEESDIDYEQISNPVMELLDEAVNQTLDMRRDEGRNLDAELRSILDRIADLSLSIEDKRPEVLASMREKLLERIDEWNLQVQIDEQRIAQEVVLLADRSDIREETARMQSHIEQFKALLDNCGDSDDYAPVGRRLDFLCQEMFREVNTMGSKSQAVSITNLVLELKSCVDQLREQVQNVE